MLLRKLFFFAAVFCVFVLSALSHAAELTLKQTDKGCDIYIDAQLFAGYITDYKGTPIIYPILGPTGKKMTRDFPMFERNDQTEAKDHPHHRSLWFTHGNVNGLDFWALEKQKIVHRKFVTAEIKNNIAVVITENDWLDQENKPVCSDVRKFCFGILGEMRYIDFDITVTSVQDSVVFGDTKEGTLGLRVPGTMDLTAKKRNPNANWNGHIVNAEGIKDRETWAKRSDWVDYYGTVEEETLGIAVLNHPSSFRYPTYWHVRDYGLFAANPFGVHDFERTTEKIGEHKMQKGESFTLRYRILFHKGDAESAEIAEAFQQYKTSK
ncbi:MAG: PmoA family protein [Planctomycetaceae bacterium]|jgi:hypothetical protein|nr:PmoA family protein [Planctomycetaceae bacterium]